MLCSVSVVSSCCYVLLTICVQITLKQHSFAHLFQHVCEKHWTVPHSFGTKGLAGH